MKQIILLIAFLLPLFFLTHAHAEAVPVHFFGSGTCGECAEIKETIIKPLQKKYKGKIQFFLHDIDSDEGFTTADQLERKFSIENPKPIELFLPDTFLLGGDAIKANAIELIEKLLVENRLTATDSSGNKIANSGSLDQAIERKLDNYSFWGLTAGALIDGINPCAIATMIFLISYLSTIKKSRNKTLLIGLIYTTAVFLTYFLLGIGMLTALTMLKGYHIVSEFIRWAAVLLALGVALFSFIDAYRYKATGNTEEITLKLPKPIKAMINKTIAKNIKGSHIAIGAFFAGFLVTLLEAVCTGQIYLPMIIVMTRSPKYETFGWINLVYYNFLFVLPLLLVLLFAHFGLKWGKLAKITQSNLTLIKVLVGILMVGLATYLFVAG